MRVRVLMLGLLLAGCEPRVTENTGFAVTIRVPATASSADAQRLADLECGKQGLRAYFRSAFRRHYTFDCTSPAK